MKKKKKIQSFLKIKKKNYQIYADTAHVLTIKIDVDN